jgi:hypothetical protein
VRFGPVLVAELAGAQLVRVHLGDRGEQALAELLAAHFHGEDHDGQRALQRDVLDDVQREGGLPHGRPTGHDDEVAGMHASRLHVEVDEPGRHARDVGRVVLMVQVVDALVHLAEQRGDADGPIVRVAGALAEREYLRLRLVDQRARLLGAGLQRALGDLGRHLREPPAQRALAHELRVAAHVQRARRVLRKLREVARPAGLPGPRWRWSASETVTRSAGLPGFDEAREVPPDPAMVVAVEVVRPHQVDDAVESLVVAEHRADQRLLGLEAVRRLAEDLQLVVHAASASITSMARSSFSTSPRNVARRATSSTRAALMADPLGLWHGNRRCLDRRLRRAADLVLRRLPRVRLDLHDAVLLLQRAHHRVQRCDGRLGVLGELLERHRPVFIQRVDDALGERLLVFHRFLR